MFQNEETSLDILADKTTSTVKIKSENDKTDRSNIHNIFFKSTFKSS